MAFKKNSEILESELLDNGILRLNLNNPVNLNALSEHMINLLQKKVFENFHNIFFIFF